MILIRFCVAALAHRAIANFRPPPVSLIINYPMAVAIAVFFAHVFIVEHQYGTGKGREGKG